MEQPMNPVAVVTGASRGAGRGIALALGETGATVYVTGRTVRGGRSRDSIAGTIDDTADDVTARGGRGIAVPCDHTDEQQVRRLFERVQAEQGRLDLLVNNVWGGYENHPQGIPTSPFWELPVAPYWSGMYEAGLRAHLFANHYAVPLMLPARRGLVVNTVAWAYDAYLGHLYYDVVKQAIIRMTYGIARELRPHGLAAVALAPGFMRTERVLAAFDAQPEIAAQVGRPAESPEYVGRAVAALAADPQVLEKSGELYTAGDLARTYGFTDVDGTQPEPFRMPERG